MENLKACKVHRFGLCILGSHGAHQHQLRLYCRGHHESTRLESQPKRQSDAFDGQHCGAHSANIKTSCIRYGKDKRYFEAEWCYIGGLVGVMWLGWRVRMLLGVRAVTLLFCFQALSV